MKKEVVGLIYGCLLHDIGKVTGRAGGKRLKHGHHGASKLEEWFEEKADEYRKIVRCVRYHMAREMNHNELDNNSVVYITAITDNIAAGTDHQNKDVDDISTDADDSADKNGGGYGNWKNKLTLSDIFSSFWRSPDRTLP